MSTLFPDRPDVAAISNGVPKNIPLFAAFLRTRRCVFVMNDFLTIDIKRNIAFRRRHLQDLVT